MIQFDSEQIRMMDWRLAAKDIAAVIGPPGSGKTTLGSALARNMVVDGLADNVLLTAYTNAATDEFGRELCHLLGDAAASKLCVRAGNSTAADRSLPIPFGNDVGVLKSKRIILCTILSLPRLPTDIRFDRLIIDEASITKIDQLLMPLQMSLSSSNTRPSSFYRSNLTSDDFRLPNLQQQLKELMNFLSHCGIVATVVGDPKQSQPISISGGNGSSDGYSSNISAIEWIVKSASHDTLHITHRLPDKLASLVNDFAQYGGLMSAPEVAGRRLNLTNMYALEHDFKQILDPDEVITWLDVRKSEETPSKESSWINLVEARACAKICKQLVKHMPQKQHLKEEKRIVIITRFTGQAMAIRNLLTQMDLFDNNQDTRVTTTTTALGTQADIVLFSLVRNNQEGYLGAAGELQDLNVSISRAKKKLIIIGNFDMMMDGYCGRSKTNYARNLAKLIESKYGKIVEAPLIIK
jgi:energy-coupling factor transporter ATP-binding protein EcfA2